MGMLRSPAWLPSPASFWPSKIRWKIIAPYLALTLVVAVLGTYLSTRLITGSLAERFDNQLAEASRVAADAVVRRERQHLETVRAISFTDGVSESIEARDAASLRRLVEPIMANDHLEYVHLLTADGTGLLDLTLSEQASLHYETIATPIDLAATLAFQHVLSGPDALGDKFAELVQGEYGSIFYTAGPVEANGRLVGVVFVGSRLNTLLPSIKLEALADVTFYDLDGGVLASTFNDSDGSLSALSTTSEDSSADAAGLRESKTLFGRDFDLLYGDLRIRDQQVGLFSIALPASFISSAGSDTRVTMAIVFSIATLAVLGIGVLIAHRVTSPLLSLVGSAHAVAEGDLTVRSNLKSRDELGTLATSFNVMADRLARQHLQTMRALTSAIDARDPYTAGHSVRVGQLSLEIGRQLELPSRDLQFLEIGGYLHDIGKIGIRDNVLLKTGPLTEEERRLIEEHPRIGIHIVQHVDLPSEILDIVAGHHEKLDGTRYPYGLNSDEITSFARIAAVADVYDALITERPYKPALGVDRAVTILKQEVTLGHLDGQAVTGLISALPLWHRRLSSEASLRGFSLEEIRSMHLGGGDEAA